MGKMVLTVLGMVAEMELGFIRERQRVGIEAAKAKGVYEGRPVTLDHPLILAMRAEGKWATEIAKALGCSRGAVYKVLNGHPAGALAWPAKWVPLQCHVAACMVFRIQMRSKCASIVFTTCTR
jgi:DNA invertase Pin-like site-specific DNA recombinase